MQQAQSQIVGFDQQAQGHADAANQAVSALADLEKGFGKTTVFRNLQQYNEDRQNVSNATFYAGDPDVVGKSMHQVFAGSFQSRPATFGASDGVPQTGLKKDLPDLDAGHIRPAVTNWLNRVATTSDRYAAARDRINQANSNFQQTVQADGRALAAAAKKDIPNGVAELNRKDGRVQTLAQEYKNHLAEASRHGLDRDKAASFYDAKLKEHSIVVERGKVRELEGKLQDLVDKREDAKFDQLLDAAKGDPNDGLIEFAKDSAVGAYKLATNPETEFTDLAEDLAKDGCKFVSSKILSADAKEELLKLRTEINELREQINSKKEGIDRQELGQIKDQPRV